MRITPAPSMVRAGDRWKQPSTLAGFILLAAGIGLEALGSHGVGTHLTLLLGAGMISPTFVVDLVRAWRARANASD